MYKKEEEILIKSAYKKLLAILKKKKISTANLKKIETAFNLAYKYHVGVYRKSGEPFILHPIAVARICAEEIGLKTTSVICALLHDTVEDTTLTIKEIEDTFDSKVAKIVNGLTKVSQASEYSSSQAETFKKIITSIFSDLRVVLVKIADRLHNIRTLESMPSEKKVRIADETLFLYAPMAHRLGLTSIRIELENLSFKYKEPKIYENIKGKLKKDSEVRKRFIRYFFLPIKKELEAREIKFSYKIRVKSIYSIWNKMVNKNIDFIEIYDLSAIRIIVDTSLAMEKTKCWEVYAIITDFYTPNQDRLRDWISIPKVNGYESLQTTVMSKTGEWVEIQIRSKRMDEIAETGLASHWKYKSGDNDNRKLFKEWIEDMKNIIESESDALEIVNNFKLNLFKDNINVYTEGKMISLPKGSCVLDLAFRVNKNKGLKCEGALINRKLRSVKFQLKDSDQVDILSGNAIRASKDWLDVLKTHTAKIEIQNYLKELSEKYNKLGRERLLNALKKYKITENTDIDLTNLASHFNETSLYVLLKRIFKREINLSFLKRFTEKNGILVKKNNPIECVLSKFEKIPKRKRLDIDSFSLIDSSTNVIDEYILAMCCNSKIKEKVGGFINDTGSLEVHNLNCKKFIKYKNHYSYRTKRINWILKEKINSLYKLNIEGISNPGTLNKIVQVVSMKQKINIHTIRVTDKIGVFECFLQVFISRENSLKETIKSLKSIKEVTRVIDISALTQNELTEF